MSKSAVALSLITAVLLGGCGGGSEPPSSAGIEDTPTTVIAEPAAVDEPDAADELELDSSADDAGGAAATASSSSASASSATPSSTVSQPLLSTQARRPQDTTIIPGQRLGVVTATTTYDELVSEFGSEQLTNSEIHLGEGFMAPSTRVDLGPDYSFSVVWTDGDRNAPMEIQELGPGWVVGDGIHNGMSLTELKAALGPFKLAGFGWDYGGTLDLEQTPLEPYMGDLFIRLQPSPEAFNTAEDALTEVMGDQFFPSSDPNLDVLDLSVQHMVVRLNTP